MKFFFLSLLLATSALANSNDLSHRPKSFSIAKGKAVFVDFTEATYIINYDLVNAKAAIKAEIKFDAPEEGFPIFDSVTAPTAIGLNGKEVTATESKTPAAETTLRVIDQAVAKGSHLLVIDLPLATLVEFKDGGVKSAFWTSDLDSREFLERYMPANFEFDQVKMNFIVKFIGAKKKQAIYTNGLMTDIDASTVKISYPSHYTSSSIFFHTVPSASVQELRFSIKSIDGRELPAVIYSAKNLLRSNAALEKFKAETEKVIHELESDYGAFPHPSVTVYNAGSGGMEYCGATMTEFRALGHELFHSYFARGVMPANGNSGWLDEALASWRDGGYQTLSTLTGTSGMSSHPYYTRTTDMNAYTFGKRFMGYLDGKLQAKGGLKPFLRHMLDTRVFSPLFVEEFSKEMSEFYGLSVLEDFKRYTYDSSASAVQKSETHPIHRKMSVKELKKFL